MDYIKEFIDFLLECELRKQENLEGMKEDELRILF